MKCGKYGASREGATEPIDWSLARTPMEAVGQFGDTSTLPGIPGRRKRVWHVTESGLACLGQGVFRCRPIPLSGCLQNAHQGEGDTIGTGPMGRPRGKGCMAAQGDGHVLAWFMPSHLLPMPRAAVTKSWITDSGGHS